MKRHQLLNHLKKHRCMLHREGAKHPIYQNLRTGKRTTVPRHSEIDNVTARKICSQLGIPPP